MIKRKLFYRGRIVRGTLEIRFPFFDFKVSFSAHDVRRQNSGGAPHRTPHGSNGRTLRRRLTSNLSPQGSGIQNSGSMMSTASAAAASPVVAHRIRLDTAVPMPVERAKCTVVFSGCGLRRTPFHGEGCSQRLWF